ncbi:MAG: hypothetical protein K5770_10520 [Lachnospiraceae bacterium]|nr:hypothetical protein [Lachnospiraceae bacterium]
MEDRNDLSRVVSDTVGKLKEFGGIAKLHARIKAEEAKKQELYYRLGKKYYSLFMDSPESDLKEIVGKLAACDEKIAKLREELSEPGNNYRDVEKDEAECSGDAECDTVEDCTDSEASACCETEEIQKEDNVSGAAEEGNGGGLTDEE